MEEMHYFLDCETACCLTPIITNGTAWIVTFFFGWHKDSMKKI